MSSSLFGIFNAHRSLLLNQAAMNLINNNIANLNTPGYSKQRLEISQKTILSPDAFIPTIGAQAGAGAEIDAITRNRDVYLDTYFRKENGTLSYYKELTENALLIEDMTNELNGTGISESLNEFYNAAHQLSLNPTDSVIRNNFVQKSIDLSDTFNLTYNRLNDLRTGLVGNIADPTTLDTSKINLTVEDLNVKLKAIADLNYSIAITTANGTTPNGLMDERDRVLDEVATYIPITVAQQSNNLVSVSLGGVNLVNGKDQVGFFDVTVGTVLDPATVKITDSTGVNIVANANSLMTSGKMGAILTLGGSDPNKINIYDILTGLDNLAREFAREVNTIHEGGQYIDTSVSPPVLTPVTVAVPPPNPFDIFVESTAATQANYVNMTAGNIKVNQDIINDAFKVATASAAAAPNETGDGSNALLIAQIRNQKLAALGASETESYLNAIVGKIGVQGKSVQDGYESQSMIVQQINTRRESTIGVNLDEELTDLIRFQRAFEASAKILNIVDKAMEQIINLVR